MVGIFASLPESCAADDSQSECSSNGSLAQEACLDNANALAAVFLQENARAFHLLRLHCYQWRSYSRAYSGLCPGKVCKCQVKFMQKAKVKER